MNLNPKVTAAAIGAAATLVIVFVMGLLGVEVPADVASAVTLIVSVAAGYLKGANDWSAR
ncbi:hypothetical protein UFOVP1158_1 [uncultured Caudovirales phage]|uniref:Holin n=1 Tax=uncultured Caudovirales phage TaxID=2100421 RepID=A0A6J5R173_9CAUD|nr:hypothetical protein UFOVP1158_1 [uncultured Caudovirales phage]